MLVVSMDCHRSSYQKYSSLHCTHHDEQCQNLLKIRHLSLSLAMCQARAEGLQSAKSYQGLRSEHGEWIHQS